MVRSGITNEMARDCDWLSTVLEWEELSSGKMYPVLAGRACSRACQVEVWCAFCRAWHVHGRCTWGNPNCEHHGRGPYWRRIAPCTCPVGDGDGHRVAHCHDDRSPYDSTGYIVRELSVEQWQKLALEQQGPLAVDCPQCEAPISVPCHIRRGAVPFHQRRVTTLSRHGAGWMKQR